MCIRQPVVVRGEEAPALHRTIQDVQKTGVLGGRRLACFCRELMAPEALHSQRQTTDPGHSPSLVSLADMAGQSMCSPALGLLCERGHDSGCNGRAI